MDQHTQQTVSLPGQANQVVELNVTGGALGLNKMSKREEAPYAAEDAQVVGLVFHQSKEVLIVDHGAGSNGDVSWPWFLFNFMVGEREVIEFNSKIATDSVL